MARKIQSPILRQQLDYKESSVLQVCETHGLRIKLMDEGPEAGPAEL